MQILIINPPCNLILTAISNTPDHPPQPARLFLGWFPRETWFYVAAVSSDLTARERGSKERSLLSSVKISHVD